MCQGTEFLLQLSATEVVPVSVPDSFTPLDLNKNFKAEIQNI
jgi:hypothetical protein